MPTTITNKQKPLNYYINEERFKLHNLIGLEEE